uniref:Putative bilaris n=1 Tax=Amblyomma parvum TaxID=251391 RepID=A0A023G1E3_AMBPA
MAIYSVFSLFLFLGLCSAASRSTKDPRCISGRPIATTTGCPTPSWQFSLSSKKCLKTCNKDGPFDSKLTCDIHCRSVDVCTAPRAVSSCAGYAHPVYFYNPTTRTCLKDMGCTYSGNNFPTIRECQETCMRRRPSPPKLWKCFVFPSQGYPCHGRYGRQKFFYNFVTGQCLPFWYFGCGGSANSFRSYRSCLKHCSMH